MNITEHVSSASLLRREISRPSSRRTANGDVTVALMRRWFWSRKPDAGFVLADYPATLLQALLLDDWLDTRNEVLDAVLTPGASAPEEVVEHYRTQGLLVEAHGPSLTLAA